MAYICKPLLLTLLVFSFPAYAIDTLHLRNGDKVTGTITSYSNDSVNIETKYGVFDIPVSDLGGVATPNSTAKRAIINAMSAKTARAQIVVNTQPPPPQVELEPSSPIDTPEIPSVEKELWGAKWSGNANIGASLRTGNSETSNLNADASLKAKWNKHRAELKADLNREDDDGEVSVDNRSVELTHDYYFHPKWFFETGAKFEQDDIDRLDLRTLISVGLGHQPYDEEDLSLKYVLGPGYLDEEFEDGSGDSSLTTQWSFDYSQKFYNDLFRLFHEHDLNAPSDDFDAFLFQSESGLRIPLRRGIIASGQIDFDWDNDPVSATQEDDTVYSLRLGYEWDQ